MKKIYTFIFTALLLTSCLEREPLNGPSLEAYPYPSNEEEALSGVLAAYKAIANTTFDKGPYLRVLDNITDVGCMRNVDTYYNMFLNSTATSQAGLAKELYSRIYKNVGRVHLVLDKLDELKDSFSDAETYYQLKAELLCLRAFNYDLGCQHFGDIPFVERSLSIDNCLTPRMPREKVIDRILSDMDDELLDHLPVAWDYKQWGHSRIGRAAAYTLKARICLNWGRFEEAAKYSDKAIELSNGIYSLTVLDTGEYTSHTVGEPSAAKLFGFEGEKSSKEWMWGMQYDRLAAANTHNSIYAMAPRTHGGAAYMGPTQAFMDTFQMKNGKKITDEDSGYSSSSPWKNRDPRLDLYCVRSGSRCLNVQFSISVADEKVKDYKKETELDNSDVVGNKSEFGPNKAKGPGGYLWRKFIDPEYYGKSLSDHKDELDHCVIRYAELLLINAEAHIEWEGGNPATAQQRINTVRSRAGMPKIEAGGDKAMLRSALRYERKVELCCEGFRWFDLRRWKDKNGRTLAEKALNGSIYAPGFSTEKNKNNYMSHAKPVIDEDWIVTYDVVSAFPNKSFNLRRLSTTMVYNPAKDALWPIPYTEMRTNTAITENNPGY